MMAARDWCPVHYVIEEVSAKPCQETIWVKKKISQRGLNFSCGPQCNKKHGTVFLSLVFALFSS